MPEWKVLVYVWILRDGRKLEDLFVSCKPNTKKILITQKETTPPAYVKISDMKEYILNM